MFEVPGTVAKHVLITDDCRLARSNEGAIDKALRRLRVEYMAYIRQDGGWASRGEKFHLVLTVELPAPSETPPRETR